MNYSPPRSFGIEKKNHNGIDVLVCSDMLQNKKKHYKSTKWLSV